MRRQARERKILRFATKSSLTLTAFSRRYGVCGGIPKAELCLCNKSERILFKMFKSDT